MKQQQCKSMAKRMVDCRFRNGQWTVRQFLLVLMWLGNTVASSKSLLRAEHADPRIIAIVLAHLRIVFPHDSPG